jgi:hypothetical protein
MVHFPTLPSPSYEFRGRYSGINQSGFPHSEIPGSKPACGSPGLIAACHVLHRLLAPRHSPYALSSLTKFSLTHCVYVVKKLPIAGYSVVKEFENFAALNLTKFCGPPSPRRGFGETSRCVGLSCLAETRRARRSSQSSLSRRLVENTGLEPVTSWLQTRRSPS